MLGAKRAQNRGVWPYQGGLSQWKLNWDLKKLALPGSGAEKKQRREIGNLRASGSLGNWSSECSRLPELVRWELNWSGWQGPGHADKMVSMLTVVGSHGGLSEVTLSCSCNVAIRLDRDQSGCWWAGWEFTVAEAMAVCKRWRWQDIFSYSVFAKIIIK